MASKTRELIDSISRHSGLGNLSEATANSMKGINHRGVGNPTNMNTDNQGLTFFTRPRLNLSYDNVSVARVLTPLLTSDPTTLPRALRVILDYVGARDRDVTSPLIDNHNAFIPLLSNNMISVSGWPDINIDTYTSSEGIQKEAYSMVDDVPLNYETYDITANFRNIAGDPITALFHAWTHYATRVKEGSMVPYPEMIVENEIDYMTRIYRLILDPSRTFVQKIACCGASFPTAVPIGGAFNFSIDNPLSSDNSQISIPFRCMGFEYNDPLTVLEFNLTVQLFNPMMADDVRKNHFVKLNKSEMIFFNYEGYPNIASNSELEWWVSKEKYRLISAEQALLFK